MPDLLQLFLLVLAFLPLAIIINRIQLYLWQERRNLPGQGTITRSALSAMMILLVTGGGVLGTSTGEKAIWLLFLVGVLGSALMVYISVMCVSESGRRFYFMILIEKQGKIPMQDLQDAYGREHMLSMRLQRLTAWGVLKEEGGSYRLEKPSAYLYSRFFQLWGNLIGFHWF
jgi:hypothetical protein